MPTTRIKSKIAIGRVNPEDGDDIRIADYFTGRAWMANGPLAWTAASETAAGTQITIGEVGEAAQGPGPGPQQIATIFTAANAPGSAAIIGYNTGFATGGDPAGTTIDSLQFVILRAIGSGTVIRFTDRSWNGSAFVAGGGDGSFAYTAGADLAAGTVVSATFSGGNVVFTVNGVASAPVSAGGFDLEQAGDTIYAYQGADANTPTTFLNAIDIADGNTTFNGSLVNTGLVAGDTALAVRYDSAAYHGPTTDAFAHLHNGDSLLQNITDSTNWNGDDHGGQVAHDQHDQTGTFNVAPDVSFWLAAGGGGNGIVSTHVDSTIGGGAQGHNMVIRYTNDQGDMVQVFANPRDISFDTAEGKFFIIDTTAGEDGKILQGNISDLIGNPTTPPTMTVLYSSNQPLGSLESQIRDMQIDTINNIIYFTHGQRFEKINYDTAGQTSTVLANFGAGSGNPVGSTNNFADDFVINFATGTVYLTSHRVIAAVDGDSVTRNYLYRITGLDPADGTNAFTFGNGLITVMPFAPDDDDTPHPLDMGLEAFPQEEGTLEGLALSADGLTLYFTTATTLWDHDGDGGFAGDGNPATTDPLLRMGGVFSYALTGNPTGAYTQIWQQLDDGDTNSQAISEIFGPQGLLDDIEVDPVTGHLYFLDLTGDQLGITNPPGDEGIWRINANGTGLEFIQAIFNNDGLGAGSLYLNRAPTVTSSTQATPTVTEPGGNPGTSSGATALVQPFISLDVTDIETASNPTQQLNRAVIWISNNFQSGASHQDTLTINGTQSGTVNGITYSYNAATGAMTLTGVTTFNNYEATIALVRFNTSGDDPTAFGTATSRTISWAVSDGLNHSDAVSTTITVTGVNDAPVNTVGAAMNFIEDTTGTAGVPAPPPAPVNAVTGISVFDVDADPATQDITVTLSVNLGTLSIRTDVAGGITAGDITGGANGTGSITITATQNQINATLAGTNNSAAPNGLVYTPPANFNGAASLTVTTNDNGLNGNDSGNTGTGTTEQDVDIKILNVADVNDAPTVVDATQDSPTILEDVPFTNLNAPTVASLFGASFSDATDVQQTGGNPTGSPGDTFAGIAIVLDGSAPATGQWEYWNGSAWTDIGASSQAAARTFTAATQIRFNPALNYNGPAPTLTVHLIETGGPAITNNGTVNLSPAGSATGGTTVYSSGTVVLGQDITAVNDAPVNTVGTTLTLAEDSGATNVTGMSISDVDAIPGTSIITVTLDVLHGTLIMSIVVPGGVTSVTGNGTATLNVTGTINQINATLAAAGGLTYTPTGNYSGSDRVQITTDDGGATGLDPGATGTGTSESDQDSKTISVTAVNDTPVVAVAASVDSTEQVAGTIDAAATITDIDLGARNGGSGDYGGSALTVGRNGGAQAQDLLGFGASGAFTVNGTNLEAGGLAFATFAGGNGANLVISFTSSGTIATQVLVNAVVQALQYTYTGDAPPASIVMNYSFSDGAPGNAGQGGGGTPTGADAITINLTAIDDLPVAQPDAFTINENGTIVGGNLFASNGSGADGDPDGPPLAISAVNGLGGNVNSTITLPSGASLTVNANGTFNYNPGTAFLPTPTLGSGASNTPGHDSFTYTLAGGNTVTVSITLTGLDTNDTLLGTAGADVLAGGIGNDTYFVENPGDQVIEAVGGGNDLVAASSLGYALGAGAEVETLSTTDGGGNAAIALTGNEFGQLIIGNAGNNFLFGFGGADTLNGGAGDDVIIVDADDLVVEAVGGGNDLVAAYSSYALNAGAEVETLSTTYGGGNLPIALTGNEFGQTIIGNAGNNFLYGFGGADTLNGGAGDDVIIVDSDDQVVEAVGGGNDLVAAYSSYALNAGAEVETLSTTYGGGNLPIALTGNEFGQTIIGNAGNNFLYGFGGADILDGGAGDDVIILDADDLVVEAVGGGNDLVAALTSYTLNAGAEVETLSTTNGGGNAAINLTGNELGQLLLGNAGANVLDGKGGNDTLTGLGGADTFAFTSALDGGNVDAITDMTAGTDRIALDDAIFTAIGGLGTLNAIAFVIGSAAADADDRIIYNSATGQLFYDADGNGGGAQILFATLTGNPVLTASDFTVI